MKSDKKPVDDNTFRRMKHLNYLTKAIHEGKNISANLSTLSEESNLSKRRQHFLSNQNFFLEKNSSTVKMDNFFEFDKMTEKILKKKNEGSGFL